MPSQKMIRTQLQKLHKAGKEDEVRALMNLPREKQVEALQAARGRGQVQRGHGGPGRGQQDLGRGRGRGGDSGAFGRGRGHQGRNDYGRGRGRGHPHQGPWRGGATMAPSAFEKDEVTKEENKEKEKPKNNEITADTVAQLMKTPGVTPEMIAAMINANNAKQ